MDIQKLKDVFRYNPRTGKLYRGIKRVDGTCSEKGGRLSVGFAGRAVRYARVCFALHFGYLPKYVRHRNGDVQDNRAVNLYDPEDPTVEIPQRHEGLYPGVAVVRCQRTGRHRGFQGSVYAGGKRHRTAITATPEEAKVLHQWLKMSLGLQS